MFCMQKDGTLIAEPPSISDFKYFRFSSFEEPRIKKSIFETLKRTHFQLCVHSHHPFCFGIDKGKRAQKIAQEGENENTENILYKSHFSDQNLSEGGCCSL